MGIEVNDGVIAGDVHQTHVTNVHQVIQPQGDIKLSWWGVMVTRNQYFLAYWIAIGIAIPVAVIWYISGANLGTFMLIFTIIWFVGYSIEAAIMNRKFTEAETNRNIRT